MRQAEEAHFFGRRRIHRQPVHVVGVTLRAANHLGVAVKPNRALSQPPMRGQPRPAKEQGGPPGIGSQDHDRGQPRNCFHESGRDEVHRDRQRRARHPEIEIARRCQITGELGILEVTNAGRLKTRFGQAVVQPGGRAIAEVRAQRPMYRCEGLQQHEARADPDQRGRDARTGLNRGDQSPHGNREDRGQHAAYQQDGPPGRGEARVGFRQRGKKLPLLTFEETASTHLQGHVEQSRRIVVCGSCTNLKSVTGTVPR